MSLKDDLERYGVNGSVSRGKVELEAVPDDLDDLTDASGTVTDPGLSSFLDRLETFEAYVDDHPEGRDRGGYVVWVEDPATKEKCFYYEPACEWNEG